MSVNPRSPILLQAQIVVPPAGSMGLADTTLLENPFQGPMWLDEIRFSLPVLDGTSSPALSWSALSVDLKLGNTPITRANVPISLLGKALNDGVNNSLAPGELARTNQTDAASSGVGLSAGPQRFTWKLPKPLFIPARELLRPTMYFTPYSGATARTVTIAYACRPLPLNYPTPAKLDVPWVSYFKPGFSAVPSSADITDQSTPNDIYNPWAQELHVQRFVGRFMGLPYFEADNFMGLASAQIDFNTGLTKSGTFVTAQDSFGNILVRDPTPFAHVFDVLDRSWTVNARLAPKGFYTFTVDRQWSGYPSNSIGLTQATVGISMVGWREVAYLP